MHKTATRLLYKLLPPVANYAQIFGCEREVTVKQSKEYQVRTKYFRTVCSTSLPASFEFETSFEIAARLRPNSLYREPPSGIMAQSLSDMMENVSESMWSKQSPTSAMRNSSSPGALKARLRNGDIYALRLDTHVKFYAWLQQQDVDYLNTPAGEALLLEELESLEIPLQPPARPTWEVRTFV